MVEAVDVPATGDIRVIATASRFASSRFGDLIFHRLSFFSCHRATFDFPIPEIFTFLPPCFFSALWIGRNSNAACHIKVSLGWQPEAT